ncbi:MAG: hypothetical protein HOP09_11555 [Hyphomicrobium sp.]|nr:hypothetical protein [Hyphomicrobium sp.]
MHITAKQPSVPLAEVMRDVAPKLAHVRNGEAGGKTLLPFYGAIGPDALATRPAAVAANVTALAPAPRERTAVPASSSTTAQAPVKLRPSAPAIIGSESRWLKTTIQEAGRQPVYIEADAQMPAAGGWVTHVTPGRRSLPLKPSN